MTLLGYVASCGRIFLADKENNVVSFAVPLVVLGYQAAVLRGDMAAAAEVCLGRGILLFHFSPLIPSLRARPPARSIALAANNY